MGIRERVVPQVRLLVGFDEFARAVRLAPQLIAPFESVQRGDAIYLTPPEASVESQRSRESIAIDDRSLHEQERKTAPPPAAPDRSGVHTHPTVRRMVAVRPEALRRGNDDGD
ncbi:MAG: hypothetical protein KIS78_01765 [Labilithrix sp.]|nr:hypothetical protein [Labilithrix sp.]